MKLYSFVLARALHCVLVGLPKPIYHLSRLIFNQSLSFWDVWFIDKFSRVSGLWKLRIRVEIVILWSRHGIHLTSFQALYVFLHALSLFWSLWVCTESIYWNGCTVGSSYCVDGSCRFEKLNINLRWLFGGSPNTDNN